MTSAIAIRGLTKRFGSHTALDGVDLVIEPGEFFGLLGPNGAGKTTLISVIAGLLRADLGEVAILGSDVRRDFRAARQKLGVVPQELVFDPFFTVRETLQIQSGYFACRNNEAWIDQLIAELGLSEKAHSNMRQLSGGMKRRVLVAQALVHRPPVIVLDEPTAGVDVELRQSLWRFVRRLNQEGHTVVLTTHYLEEAQELCTRIAMLKAGRVVALDRTEALLKSVSGMSLRLRLASGSWPQALAGKRIAQTGDTVADSTFGVFRVADASEVGEVLEALKLAGCKVADIELARPDLEDAFLRIVGA